MMALTTTEHTGFKQIAVEDFRITDEPFYLPIKDEIELFETAYENGACPAQGSPPAPGRPDSSSTCRGGCTTAKVAEHEEGVPLITVACHEDLTASDLVGRYLLEGDETAGWMAPSAAP
jgi:nitric oxide reductase NorQ protein